MQSNRLLLEMPFFGHLVHFTARLRHVQMLGETTDVVVIEVPQTAPCSSKPLEVASAPPCTQCFKPPALLGDPGAPGDKFSLHPVRQVAAHREQPHSRKRSLPSAVGSTRSWTSDAWKDHLACVVAKLLLLRINFWPSHLQCQEAQEDLVVSQLCQVVDCWP